MNRVMRRTGQSVLVAGMAAVCVDWMRERRNQPPAVVDSECRRWEAFWPRTVGVPDMQRWRIIPEDDIVLGEIVTRIGDMIAELTSAPITVVDSLGEPE